MPHPGTLMKVIIYSDVYKTEELDWVSSDQVHQGELVIFLQCSKSVRHVADITIAEVIMTKGTRGWVYLSNIDEVLC